MWVSMISCDDIRVYVATSNVSLSVGPQLRNSITRLGVQEIVLHNVHIPICVSYMIEIVLIVQYHDLDLEFYHGINWR